MSDSRHFLLIDANAIGYASQLGMNRLSTGDQATHAIWGSLNTVRKLMVTYKGAVPVALWDGNATWRKEANENYKANRSDDPKKIKVKDEYHTQTPYLRRLYLYMGIDQMLSVTCEADDLAGAYSRLLEKAGHTVTLVTGDQDWLQLVTPKVDWYDPIRDRRVDIVTFEDFTGYPNTEQFLDAKCLMGDTSDNIKGVGGIGKVGAKKLLDKFGSVSGMFADKTEDFTKLPKAWRELILNPDRYHANYKLMALDGKHPSIKDREIIPGKPDWDEFIELCRELAFLSIIKAPEKWRKAFAR